jgi:1,5-anhydro-D-fructose reductase (1,5-anhydro-D-mannitol-forming)
VSGSAADKRQEIGGLKVLRVAMLSYWHVHAPGYTREILALPDTKITVVWDELPQRGREWAQKIGAEYVEDLDAAVNREDVDAVIVNAPTNMHPEVIIAAAKAGKHIFTEKVLALTQAEANQIADAVRAAQVRFCISFPQRTRSGMLFIKQAITEGWLGQVTLLRAHIAHTGTIDKWLPPHFLSMEQCGGGSLIDLGAHPMYAIEYLMGMPQTVTARYNQVTAGLEVEDNAVVVMTYANGGLAIAESSFCARNSPFTIEAHGTEGTLYYGFPDAEVRINSRKLSVAVDGWLTPTKLPKALPSAMRQWVDAIRGGAPVVFDLDAACNLSTLMEAANISARQERTVHLPFA